MKINNNITRARTNKVPVCVGTIVLSLLIGGCSVLGRFSTDTTGSTTLSSQTLSTMAPTEPTVETDAPAETTLPPINPEAEFVNLLYMELLGREATEDEKNNLVYSMDNNSITVNTVVLSVINSSEFESKGYSDETFINICYKLFMRIIPDVTMQEYWMNLMENGYSRADIIKEFINAEAFRELCSGYGFLPEYDGSSDDFYSSKEAISNITDMEAVQGIGGYVPSTYALTEINSALEALSNRGTKVGFIVLNLQTNQGICYNTDRQFYTASSIKGPFAVSLAKYNPEAAERWNNTITNMLVNSDNDAYTALNDSFRRTYIQQFCEEWGVDPALCVYKYPQLACKDLALLWVGAYNYFEEDEFGDSIGAIMENPAYSLIHSEFEDVYTTRSKAGWEFSDINSKHNGTTDAGIVYTDHGDYLIVIMSTVPRDIEPLRPLLKALENSINEM